MTLPSRDYVRKAFLHEPSTGWLIRRKNSDIVGCSNTQGHLQVRIHGVRYYVHQIVWLYYFGFIPKLIDHINRNPADNRLENLRPADKSINSHNSKHYVTNTSGTKGVYFCKTKQRWKAVIEVRGRKISKSFESKDDAIKHRKYLEELHVIR
jgi:hypothetical protein